MKKLENILKSQRIETEILSKKSLWDYQQKWREIYAKNLFDATSKWTFKGIDWHVFSYNYTRHLTGDNAWNKYREKCGPNYLILPNLNEGKGYICKSESPVNLSMKGFDLYICPEDMGWTFVNTHEEGWVGPFFSEKNMIKHRTRRST